MMHTRTHRVILAGFFAAMTAVGAFLKIPFYPVPFTLQTFFTAMAGLVLPARWAAASQMVYLLVGLLGLPVFANGGGIGYVLQPTFGYLLFLPVSAFLIAVFISSTPNASLIRTTLLVSLGSLVVLLGGALWLYGNLIFIVEKEVSFLTTVYSGFFFFLPAMILKALLASLVWISWKKRLDS